jgi:hypothetical protein
MHFFGKFEKDSVVLYKGTPHKVLSVTGNGWHVLAGVPKKVRSNELKAIVAVKSPKKTKKTSPKKKPKSPKKTSKKKKSPKKKTPVFSHPNGSDLVTDDGLVTVDWSLSP